MILNGENTDTPAIATYDFSRAKSERLIFDETWLLTNPQSGRRERERERIVPITIDLL